MASQEEEMSALENTGPMHNTKAYTESSYWDKLEERKKKESEEARKELERMGIK